MNTTAGYMIPTSQIHDGQKQLTLARSERCKDMETVTKAERKKVKGRHERRQSERKLREDTREGRSRSRSRSRIKYQGRIKAAATREKATVQQLALYLYIPIYRTRQQISNPQDSDPVILLFLSIHATSQSLNANIDAL